MKLISTREWEGMERNLQKEVTERQLLGSRYEDHLKWHHEFNTTFLKDIAWLKEEMEHLKGDIGVLRTTVQRNEAKQEELEVKIREVERECRSYRQEVRDLRQSTLGLEHRDDTDLKALSAKVIALEDRVIALVSWVEGLFSRLMKRRRAKR